MSFAGDPLVVVLKDRCRIEFSRLGVLRWHEDGSRRLKEFGFSEEEGREECLHGLSVHDSWESLI